ncbi:MAG: bifunctional demethylmenaquinone methyltransferase/2-methoxy-6-polyprenyl-1,4-benzoquinol methylase UbiE [Chitinophagaceae bacterium]|nr:bifunctional demethylmenaquinone methyltransferase/2-methoxy-6-polyprenyl-1,4-benzoquinol methylase UbiE [Chitinophagaceae bacterium]
MFEHDKIKPFEGAAGSKKEQVATMFDQIAHRYDFLNRFLSAGIDVSWRKKAIRELQALKPRYILDVATGTADVAILTSQILKPAPEKIAGIDISAGMLELGRKKLKEKKLDETITLYLGDSEAINFPDNTFDAITVAFGVRNFANLERGLQEMLRVLKPGGKAVILEFSKPTLPGVKGLYNLYTRLVAPQAGKVIARNEAAYRYLNDSIQAFPEGRRFVEILQGCGYTHCYKKTLSLGICTVYCGSKS